MMQESPMQTRTLLASIATVACAAIATPSFAQTPTPTPTPTPPQQTSKGEVAMAPSFNSLITAINATSAQNDKVKDLKDVSATNVMLVNVNDLLKGNDVAALNEALKKNDADLSTLRTTLGANSALNGVLTSNATPLTPADVVATDVTADGHVMVYYWKKP
jgi:hypothetical protein